VIVVSSLFTSFFSSVSTFGTVDCHVPSSSHRLDNQSNRGRKRLIVTFTPPNLPSHVVYAHHIQQSSHIARVCASSTEAVSLARQSNEQPRWQRRQQKAFGGVGRLWWPSSDDSEAVGHGFDGCLVRCLCKITLMSP
jgi:hypothetical protein